MTSFCQKGKISNNLVFDSGMLSGTSIQSKIINYLRTCAFCKSPFNPGSDGIRV